MRGEEEKGKKFGKVPKLTNSRECSIGYKGGFRMKPFKKTLPICSKTQYHWTFFPREFRRTSDLSVCLPFCVSVELQMIILLLLCCHSETHFSRLVLTISRLNCPFWGTTYFLLLLTNGVRQQLERSC